MVRYNALKGLYDVEKTIGCGGFAKVKLATHLATGEKVAIKIMDKGLLGDDLPRVKVELKALKALSHEHICQLFQIIETETHFFIVMEHCSGGELFDHIVEKNRLSESESRMFFRQIISAVAYLHSLGYAHRDLKPENVLLDKDQNLKLIDFGLCARPEGGIANPLFTSCGSPTYAAPELILGKQYLGPEVDVWAMGVLLYALLVGALPFDDLNIDGLYKKILNGKYEEPSFLTRESRQLIRAMLQVDPKKRITVNQLLSHSWLTLNILDPVQCKSEIKKKYDADCVNIVARHYKLTSDDMWTYLRKWRYDYHTATYFLLLARKKRLLKLNPLSTNFQFKLKMFDTPVKQPKLTVINSIETTITEFNSNSINTTPKTPLSQIYPGNVASPKVMNVFSPNGNDFREPHRPDVAARKPLKRFRSPTLDGDGSPVPHKKPTPSKSTMKTPESKQTPSTPGSTRRVLLGSIERSLNKVRYAFTPKKSVPSEITTSQPVFLTTKNLCNVSTTQCHDPEYVINELSKALQKKGIHCDRKGFILRGKMEPNAAHRLGGCSFELEICYLPSLGQILRTPKSVYTPTKSILKNVTLHCTTPTTTAAGCRSDLNFATPSPMAKNSHKSDDVQPLVGIRRKRLKGDSWCYKKVCEEVLALTATEFRQVALESAV